LFRVPYIPGTATASRTRITKMWEYRAMPSVYMPANVRIAEDHSKYYIKTPQEMSRFEIAELERELRMLDEIGLEQERHDVEGYDDMNLFDQLMYNPEFAEYHR
jgi:hypothetical protein